MHYKENPYLKFYFFSPYLNGSRVNCWVYYEALINTLGGELNRYGRHFWKTFIKPECDDMSKLVFVYPYFWFLFSPYLVTLWFVTKPLLLSFLCLIFVWMWLKLIPQKLKLPMNFFELSLDVIYQALFRKNQWKR